MSNKSEQWLEFSQTKFTNKELLSIHRLLYITIVNPDNVCMSSRNHILNIISKIELSLTTLGILSNQELITIRETLSKTKE